MPYLPIRIRLLTLFAALPLSITVCAAARADDPSLEVLYTRLDPKESFRYTWKGQAAVCNAGVFRWQVPAAAHDTQNLDRDFTGYCAEVLVPIVADHTYRFRVSNIYDPANYNLGGLPADKVGEAANRRGRLVQELFARHFRNPAGTGVSATDAVAFQVALWEVIQEGEPGDGSGPKLDLFGGDFRADYPVAQAPAYVTRAQEYLGSLTGKADGLLVDNPDLRGKELIRLGGVANAEGVVAQSQFALRYKDGGAAGPAGGGAFARALTAGGGYGGGGPGGRGAGYGTGGGTGFAPSLGGGQTSGSSFANGPDAPGGTGTTVPVNATTPAVGGPLSTPTTTVPFANSPDSPGGVGGTTNTPSAPVPAPAGLLLGASALGAVGAWRAWMKLIARK